MNSLNGIHGFITDRLADDERIAKAALGETERSWDINTEPDLPAKHVQGRPSIQTGGMGWQTDSGDGIWSCDDPEDDCRLFRREDQADAEHITRFDPQRILRDSRASRALLDVYEIAEKSHDILGDGYVSLRKAVVALAEVWKDHPDYNWEWNDDDEEWTP